MPHSSVPDASAPEPGDVSNGAAEGVAAARDAVGAPSHQVAAVGALSYEEARDELVRVVNELERGASTLEQSLELWERGEALAARCEEWLVGAKTRLDRARAAQSDSGRAEGQGRRE